MLRIVSHTRTGTHCLCSLLFRNLETGAADYEEMHYSHSRVPPDGAPYIHLHRPLFSTLLSIWRVREHAGIHGDVTFSDLVHVPHRDLPKAETCEAVFNGVRQDKVCPGKGFLDGETFPERWLRLTQLFEKGAHASYSYEEVVTRPMFVVVDVAWRFGVARKPGFAPVLDRVGWWAAKDETPTITERDMRVIEEYQNRWLSSLGTVRRS